MPRKNSILIKDKPAPAQPPVEVKPKRVLGRKQVDTLKGPPANVK